MFDQQLLHLTDRDLVAMARLYVRGLLVEEQAQKFENLLEKDQLARETVGQVVEILFQEKNQILPQPSASYRQELVDKIARKPRVPGTSRGISRQRCIALAACALLAIGFSMLPTFGPGGPGKNGGQDHSGNQAFQMNCDQNSPAKCGQPNPFPNPVDNEKPLVLTRNEEKGFKSSDGVKN